MTAVLPTTRRFVLPALAVVIGSALLAATAADPAANDPPTPRASARTPTVPPVPDGPPADLLAYIDQLADPAAMPSSRGRLRYYLRRAAAATVDGFA